MRFRRQSRRSWVDRCRAQAAPSTAIGTASGASSPEDYRKMRGLNRHLSRRSRAIIALLLFVLLVSPSCASSSATGNAKGHQAEGAGGAEATWPGKDGTASTGGQEKPEKNNKKDDDSGKTVEAVLPEDVLSDKELKEKQAPKYTDWYKASEASSKKSLTSDSTVGSIPAVKPFNLGRDPGGPENKTLYLTVPKL